SLGSLMADERRPARLAAGAGDAKENLGVGRRLRRRGGRAGLAGPGGGRSPFPLRLDRRAGEHVGALVPAVTGVALHPVPLDLVLADQLREVAPEVDVLELAVLALP